MRASARPRSTHLWWAAAIPAALVGFAACADSIQITLPDGGKTSSSTTSQNTGGSAGCVSNAACTWPQAICDTTKGSCVECLVNEDCAGKPHTVCSEGECRCPPTPDAGKLSYCPALNDDAARCVDTQTAASDCGDCNHACFGACAAGKCSSAWSRVSTNAQIAGRAHHVAVATTEASPRMIVWGGQGASGVLATGGIYDPATDAWKPISTVGAPAARRDATAVWDPEDGVMIVWGGSVSGSVNSALADGGVYDPATDTWSAINKEGGPTARFGHSAVWSSSLGMIVFGGEVGGGFSNDTYLYSPKSDTWNHVPHNSDPTAEPTGRRGHNAVWIGAVMFAFGGFGPPDTTSGSTPTYLGDLWSWDASNSWKTFTVPPTVSVREGAAAVVADKSATSKMLVVWGGTNNSPPVLDGFTFDGAAFGSTSTNPAVPEARTGHSAVAIGSQVLVFGGKAVTYQFDDGLWSLDTTSLGWTKLVSGPERRANHTAVAVGTKMIVFGGDGPNGYLANGAAYETAAP